MLNMEALNGRNLLCHSYSPIQSSNCPLSFLGHFLPRPPSSPTRAPTPPPVSAAASLRRCRVPQETTQFNLPLLRDIQSPVGWVTSLLLFLLVSKFTGKMSPLPPRSNAPPPPAKPSTTSTVTATTTARTRVTATEGTTATGCLCRGRRSPQILRNGGHCCRKISGKVIS